MTALPRFMSAGGAAAGGGGRGGVGGFSLASLMARTQTSSEPARTGFHLASLTEKSAQPAPPPPPPPPTVPQPSSSSSITQTQEVPPKPKPKPKLKKPAAKATDSVTAASAAPASSAPAQPAPPPPPTKATIAPTSATMEEKKADQKVESDLLRQLHGHVEDTAEAPQPARKRLKQEKEPDGSAAKKDSSKPPYSGFVNFMNDTHTYTRTLFARKDQSNGSSASTDSRAEQVPAAAVAAAAAATTAPVKPRANPLAVMPTNRNKPVAAAAAAATTANAPKSLQPQPQPRPSASSAAAQVAMTPQSKELELRMRLKRREYTPAESYLFFRFLKQTNLPWAAHIAYHSKSNSPPVVKAIASNKQFADRLWHLQCQLYGSALLSTNVHSPEVSNRRNVVANAFRFTNIIPDPDKLFSARGKPPVSTSKTLRCVATNQPGADIRFYLTHPKVNNFLTPGDRVRGYHYTYCEAVHKISELCVYWNTIADRAEIVVEQIIAQNETKEKKLDMFQNWFNYLMPGTLARTFCDEIDACEDHIRRIFGIDAKGNSIWMGGDNTPTLISDVHADEFQCIYWNDVSVAERQRFISRMNMGYSPSSVSRNLEFPPAVPLERPKGKWIEDLLITMRALWYSKFKEGMPAGASSIEEMIHLHGRHVFKEMLKICMYLIVREPTFFEASTPEKETAAQKMFDDDDNQLLFEEILEEIGDEGWDTPIEERTKRVANATPNRKRKRTTVANPRMEAMLAAAENSKTAAKLSRAVSLSSTPPTPSHAAVAAAAAAGASAPASAASSSSSSNATTAAATHANDSSQGSFVFS